MKRPLIFAASWVTVMFVSTFFFMAFATEIRYDSGDRRDPFIPLIGPDGIMPKVFDPSDLRIEGIIYDPKGTGSLVLINGEFYRQGDTVKDSNVITIFKDRVVLQQEDQEKVMWIREETIGDGLTREDKPEEAKPQPFTNPDKPVQEKNASPS